MTKRLGCALLSVMLLLTGCFGQNRLDELTLILTLGVDITKDGELDIYSAVPVFRTEAREKTEILHVHASSFREGRDRFDDEANGLVETGKVQNLIVSKKVLMKKGLFDLLDVIFRDTKSALKVDLIMADESIEKVMGVSVRDKPRLPVYLRELVRSGHKSEASVYTTARKVYDQFYEKGITPYLTEIKLNENKVKIAGTALLDKRGYYMESLDELESIQLLILQQDTKHPIFITMKMMDNSFQGKDEESKNISFSIDYTDYKYRTSVKDGKFQFDLHFKHQIVLTEVLVKANPLKEKDRLEKAIALEMKKKMEAVVAKLQKRQLDPIGLGKYARAYAYDQWRTVEDDWGRAFSQAKINIIPEVKIISVGSLKR
ncbi:Ger(x)C family spore germination protein [Brevibacillus choshinensis]|uniref:Ger(X)C family spore germination protein n=1 Tax=Brevibacillus choshinensis TaxID=54911 RepID=A0ABX7FX57_BRECH|nr:Ger(x)C family spore germination protein [Brevibacillus choshinensis]QRG70394.1 Ger(x)C family spore germination protein [Brevibacillus choshinensis]